MTIISSSTKLSSMISNAKLVHFPSVLPEEKSARECFIVQKFAEIQTVSGHVLTDIRSSPDDSHGKADVLAKCNGVEVGIQLTELKISHRPESSARAWTIVDGLLGLILAEVTPPYPVFVDVWSSQDYENACIKLVGRDLKRFAKLISRAIANEQFSPSIKDYFGQPKVLVRPRPLDIPDSLKSVITRIEVSKVPEGYATMCQGRDNVHINFHFDIVVRSEETFKDLAQEVFRKKSHSSVPLLLVWSRDQDFWGEEESVARALADEAKSSSFDYIFYFSFMDGEGLFDANKRVMVIKGSP